MGLVHAGSVIRIDSEYFYNDGVFLLAPVIMINGLKISARWGGIPEEIAAFFEDKGGQISIVHWYNPELVSEGEKCIFLHGEFSVSRKQVADFFDTYGTTFPLTTMRVYQKSVFAPQGGLANYIRKLYNKKIKDFAKCEECLCFSNGDKQIKLPCFTTLQVKGDKDFNVNAEGNFDNSSYLIRYCVLNNIKITAQAKVAIRGKTIAEVSTGQFEHASGRSNFMRLETKKAAQSVVGVMSEMLSLQSIIIVAGKNARIESCILLACEDVTISSKRSVELATHCYYPWLNNVLLSNPAPYLTFHNIVQKKPAATPKEQQQVSQQKANDTQMRAIA